MAKPVVQRRVKSYSSQSGTTYQYYFYEVQKTTRKDAASPLPRSSSAGRVGGASRRSGPVTVYTYLVSSDRRTTFPLHVCVWQHAVRNWERRMGRPMTGTEEYALAKLRLFRGFDEAEEPLAEPAELFVDDSNLDELLSQLDL